MHDEELVVIGGVDAHADAHEVAALDQRGRLLGTKRLPSTFTGYGDLLDWLRAFGAIELGAIESTGSSAAGLTRYLPEHGVAVVEVNQRHAHTRRRCGKSADRCSSGSSGPRRRAPRGCSGSQPVTPGSRWSPPARTSSASAAMLRSRRPAVPARSRRPRGARHATASTTAVTATPTAPCT
jgi:transposase